MDWQVGGSGTFENAIDIARRALDSTPRLAACRRPRRILWPHRLAAKKVRRAEKYRRLAQECVDPAIRKQVTAMANEWFERAKAKGSPPPKAA